MRKSKPLMERWRAKVDTRDGMSSCWPWTGAKNKKGYGRIGVGLKSGATYMAAYAHRVAYELFVGAIGDGMVVRHRCDHPWCVNPAHLEVGTSKDNVRDAMERGLHVYPPTYHREGHPRAKLNMESSAELRSAVQSKAMTREGAAFFFGVSKSTVHRVMSGESWGV